MVAIAIMVVNKDKRVHTVLDISASTSAQTHARDQESQQGHPSSLAQVPEPAHRKRTIRCSTFRSSHSNSYFCSSYIFFIPGPCVVVWVVGVQVLVATAKVV